MLDHEQMAKDLAHMTHAERMVTLVTKLDSPACVTKADEILALIEQERLDVLGVRERAAQRHSDTAAPKAHAKSKTEQRSGIETISGLVSTYLADRRASYHKLRFKTRAHYDSLIKRLLEDCPDQRLADLKAADIMRLYGGWAGNGQKLAMGHAMMAMVRILINYGATVLEDGECIRLSVVLRNTRFKQSKSRREQLTAEQASAIIRRAHEEKYHSIALAQAFQFDCPLGQGDVLGEWVPQSEPGVSDVTDEDRKWLRGIRWSEIDENLVLRHPSSRDGKLLESRLSETVLVRAELERFDRLPASGPVIVSELTKLPWDMHVFRRIWRKIATDCGVPNSVYNMDSQARGERRGRQQGAA